MRRQENELLLRLLLVEQYSRLASTPCSSDTELGEYFLIRPSSAFDWCQRKTDTFLEDHARQQRKAALLYDPELEDAVPIFNFMGACMRMVYMGAGMETAGDLHTFQPCAAVIPNVPSSVPARLRQTYWRWIPKMGTQDVLLASLTEVLLAFMDMHSFAQSNDPDVLSRVYDRIHSSSVHAFMHHEPGQMSKLLTLHDDPVVSEVAKYFSGASSVPGVARPVRVEDYKCLAQQCGWTYLGVGVDEFGTVLDGIPGSVFHSTAVLESCDAVAPPGLEKKRQLRSFWSLHFELQRRMPTTKRLRWAADALERSLDRSPTVEELCSMFPACSGSAVKDLWEKTLETPPGEVSPFRSG